LTCARLTRFRIIPVAQLLRNVWGETCISIPAALVHRRTISRIEFPFFAVTGPKGQYEIKGLPPAKYTLAVWQEKRVEATQEIEVKAKDRKTAEFALVQKKD
jgi:hypothetical protein